MPTVHTFQVVPALPESLTRLREIAYNLRWAWNHEAIELFLLSVAMMLRKRAKRIKCALPVAFYLDA